ncbi:MAG: ABC-F family ATP-binding cassette domain-containing protein [Anaerolineae bacterium]|nr:ABC-F family ATP-binding cassette domain-containing protein [Anaerolineae bacterium]
MLQVRDITKRFGDVLVLDRINFNLNRGDRAGLIGPNGSGKTTLLRILVGELAPERGAVHLAPASLRVGYLPQALEFQPKATVGEVLRAARGLEEDGEARLARLAEAVAQAQGDALAAALAEYDRALAEFQESGGGRLRADAATVLAGLGMGDVDQESPVGALSGGQKTRLGLVCLLLSQPDLLLLDEPTNHLDIRVLAWLEEYLAQYPGAVLLISHDRAFLDRTVTRILALDDVTHTLREYVGNYSDYALSVDRELDRQWATYREQQARVRQLEASIRHLDGKARGIERETEGGRHGRMAKDFYRRVAKDVARHATAQKRRLERMLDSEEMVEKPGLTWKMKLEFADTPRSGQDVLHVAGLRMGFGERVLFTDVNLHLTYGARAVLVGPNGSGKTTLLRCITSALSPWAGEIRLGRGVRLGYMAQEQETLPPDATPYALIRGAAPLDETEARNFLHYFLFTGDEVFVPVGQLSFGERSRLMLALLAVQGCNFLLLDEPINHLDIPSRERFEQAMARFTGTALAVVHDRYFIERFATTVWSLEDGRVRVTEIG